MKAFHEAYLIVQQAAGQLDDLPIFSISYGPITRKPFEIIKNHVLDYDRGSCYIIKHCHYLKKDNIRIKIVVRL